MRRSLITLGLLVAVSVVPAVASAQNRNTNTNTGDPTGFGNTGSSGFGSTSGSSPFGNSGFGSNATGGFGANAGAGGLGGQTGFGANGQTGFGANGQAGANGANGGILGRNTNINQFLGRATQNQGMQGNNTGGGGGRGGDRRGNGQGGQNGGGGNTANANQTPLVRPRQKIAFDYPIPTPSALQTTIEGRLTKLSLKNPSLKGVMIAVEDKGEVVLRGEVASVSEAKLAENMLRLEPGVRTIRNELSFPAPAPATDE